MKTRKSRLKSFFAMLLVVSMVCQQSSLTVLATDDTYVEDEIVTPTPSGSEAEEYTEEKTEPEAEESEEPVQEPTEAPAEQLTEAPAAEPTEAPAEQPTEAPAAEPTEAPAEQPTEAPAAEPTETPAAEVTEAPAAPEATATPTPEVSAVPSETPTPTPTEAPKTSFRYEDSRVVITATAPEDANLPQDAEIKADYIAPGTDRYNAAVAAFNSQLSSQLGLNAENTTAEYVLYDVYFLTADGNRIEPESGNVKVDMSFKKIQESNVDGDIINKDVVHLDNDGQAEVVTEYVNTNADGEITSMGFMQDSFSIVGGVTTYEDTSTGENGDNVTYQETTDLSKLLNGVTLIVDSKTTVIEKDTKVTLRNNEEISLSLSFLEQEEAGGYQFSTSERLEYTLPDGFIFPQKITDQEFSITVDKKDSTGTHRVTIPGNKYSVVGNKLYVTLANNPDLKSVANASFALNLKAKVTTVTNGEKINFGGNKSMEVELDNKSHVSVEKQITKYDDDGTAHYKIVVKSVGENTNVTVTDRFSSDVLEYQKDVTAKRNGTDIILNQENGNKLSYNDKDGFTSVIAKMNDGDEITYEYTAKVDYSKVKDGTVSSDKKKNTVTVVPNGDDTEKKEDSAEYNNKISYDWVSKTNGTENSAGNSISWTLTVNEDRKQSAAGMVVTDTIDEASRKYLSYAEGTKIVCNVYAEDNTLVRSDTLSAGTLGTLNQYEAEKDSSGKIIGWKYIVPSTDTKAYKYVFSYDTILDKGNLVNDVTVKNSATVDGKGTDTGSTEITGIEVDGKKEVVKLSDDKETTTWRITVDLPAEGLDSLVVTDTLPKSGWFTDSNGVGGTKTDKFNGIKFITSGYENKYELRQDSSKFELTFYKDEEHNNPGVEAGEANRKIVIEFETLNDDEWKKKADEDSGQFGTHTNDATITANGVEIKKSAQVVVVPIGEKKISKERKSVNGNTWTYKIVLEGVKENRVEITDELDQYMSFKAGNPLLLEGWSKIESYYGSGYWYNGGEKKASVSMSMDESKKRLTFTCENVPKDENNHYYKYYVLFYDVEVDSDSIASAAGNSEAGKYTVTNNVSWGDKKGSCEIDVPYNGLTKEMVKADSGNSYVAKYTLDINPQAADLFKGNDEITITDTSEHLSIKEDTITVTNLTPGEALNWSYSISDNVLTITITNGDGKHIRVEYSARVLGSGSVTYKNDAKVEGTSYEDSKSENVEVSTSGSGVGSSGTFTILKLDKDDNKDKLAGAEFELYQWVENESIRSWVRRQKKEGENYYNFVTDANGTVEVAADAAADGWSLTPGKYKIKEIKAPAGYPDSLMEYEFELSNVLTGVANEYSYGSTIVVTNDKSVGQLTIVKNLEGRTGDETKFNVTVELKDENGNAYTGKATVNGTEQDVENGEVEVTISQTTGATISGLPVGTQYRVTEGKLDPSQTAAGYSKVDVTGETGAIVAAGNTVTVNNKWEQPKGSLTIVKALEGKTGDETKFNVTVELKDENGNAYTGKATVNGTEQDVENGEVEVTISQTTGATISGLPVGTQYRVTEGKLDPSQTAAGYSKVDVTGETGAIVAAGNTVTVNNKWEQPKGSLTIVKALEGKTGDETKFNVTVELKDENGNAYTGKATVNGTEQDVENGEVEVTISQTTGATISGLPVGTQYRVTEGKLDPSQTAAGYSKVDVTGETGAIVAAGNTVTVNNKWEQPKGSLTIVKALEGKTGDETKFNVTVELKDENGNAYTGKATVNGTEQDVENGEVEVTISQTTGATISGLPVGTQYRVTEGKLDPSQTAAGYSKVDVTGETGAIVAAGNTVTVNNKWEQPKGSLTIVKALEGKTGDETKFNVTVELKDENGNAYTGKATVNGTEQDVENGEVEVTISQTTGATISGLPVGTQYRVTEGKLDPSQTAAGYSKVDVTGETGAIVAAGNTVTVNNKWEQPKGSLTIVKALEGKTGDETKFNVTVELKDENGNAYTGKATVNGTEQDVENGEVEVTISQTTGATISGLPVGTQYRVTEGKLDPSQTAAGYSKVDVTGETGAIVAAGNTVTVNNKWEQPKGSLTIVKALEGKTGDETKFNVTVELKDENGNAYTGKATVNGTEQDVENGEVEVTISQTTGATISGLPVGTQYRVTEGKLDPSQTAAGYSKVDVTGETGAIVAAGNTVTVNNKWEQPKGSLTIVKALEGKTGDETKFNVTVELKDENGNAYTGKATVNGTEQDVENGEVEVTISQTTGATISGLPVGTQYRVTEGKLDPSQTAAGYSKVDVTGETGAIVAAGNTVTVNNKWEQPKGSLTIVKALEGKTGDETKFNVTVELKDENGNAYTGKATVNGTEQDVENGEVEVTISQTTGATISGLPVGTQYRVTEGKLDPSQTAAGYSKVDVTGETGAIVAAGNTVTVNNKWEQPKGSLTIVKALEGKTGDETKFNVTVELKDENGNACTGKATVNGTEQDVENGEVEVTISQTTGATISGLPVGTQYRVTEGKLDPSQTAAGYSKVDVTGETGAIVAAGNTVTVNNKWEQPKGSLTIVKNLEGKTGDETKFSVTVELKDENGNAYTGKAKVNGTEQNVTDGKITVEISQTTGATISELPIGTQYKVTEGDLSEGQTAAGYSKVDVTGETGAIVAAGNTVTVNNKWEQPKGSLTITKDSVGGDTPDDAEFVVVGSDGTEYATKKYSDFKQNGSFTVSDLPVGKYKVVEKNAQKDGFYLETTTSSDIQVEKDNETKITITNTYLQASITLGAVKSYNKALTGGEFEFNLEQVKDANGTAITDSKPYTDSAKNDADGNVTFKEIKYTTAGTYYYKISEKNGGSTIKGIEYDKNAYVVTVTVAKVGNELVASVDKAIKDITFANTYKASADLQLKAQKSMKAESEKLGTFEFELKDADGTVIETVKNDEKGVISFSKLSYTEKDAGRTFTYTVNEKIPSEADSYIYDKTVYTVTVNVEDNRDGTLKLTTKVNGKDYTETAMKFVNDSTKVTITKVNDTDRKALLGAKLQIVDAKDNVVEKWTTDGNPHVIIGNLILGETYKLVEKEAPKGYKIADPITFVMQPDGTITVNAEPVSENKLTMVDAKLHFNVNKVELGNGKEVEGAHLVVIDKETGKNVDEWVSEKGKTHDFGPKLEAGKSYILRETVAPAGYKYATDIEFTVKNDGTIETDAKTTTDKDDNKVYLVEDDTTKVTITKVDALGNQLLGVVLEIQDKDGNPIETWTTDRTPHVITGKLILGETYKLVEKSAPAGYALADPVEFTVSADDTDNVVTMVNIYSASGKLDLTAKKTLTTTETPLAAGQFTFELCDKDGNVLQTKTNDADGNVTFDEISYNLVKDAAYNEGTDKKVDDTGKYLYTVNEVSEVTDNTESKETGYTYDDTIYTINVTVEDAGNGTLTVTPVIHSSKSTSEDAAVAGMEFTNTYKTSGQIVLSANKTLEGQTLEAEQFSFQATEIGEDGNVVENGYNETVKNADGGAITFPIITYEKSGTHYYQITEVKDEKPAYQYDESKYVVKVDVTDDNAGKLTAKVTAVTKNGEPVENGEPAEESSFAKAVTFTNTYSASADLELKAQKSMKVEGEELGTFEFELKDADGNVIETVKNDEHGAINFSKLSYDEKAVGQTFTYTVNEKIPSEADIYVYDDTVYTVTVGVEDNRDGTLKLTTKVNGEDYTEEAIKFVNDTTKVTISKVDDTSLKALSGAKLQVVDAEDKVVEEWTSDGTPHMITAKLVLGATYKLVEAEAPLGYEIAEPITFTVDADDTKNAVEMKDAMTKSETAAIEITKELKLNDALVGAKDMTFYVALFADEECTILASDVKALEFKNASSSTVTFTGVDLGRTYYVSETDEAGKAIESGMTPDGKVYIPAYPQGKEITVTEDGAKSSITFENQFNEWPDGFYKIANLNVTKELLGADGNALESDGVFYAGIFDDKECTTLSTRTEKNILTLDLAGGSTVSESTQAVVMPGESFNLYVAETDAEGNLVAGTEGFKYVVTVEDGNVYFDENNLNAKVTIINKEQPEATPTVTPEETPTPTPTPSSSTGVKTGDDTPIGFYMAMLFLAALAIEETTRRRRKKEQD